MEKIFGTSIKVFVPPWDKYDAETVSALEGMGFEVLSAGVCGYAKKNSSLKFVPATTGINFLQSAVKITRDIKDTNPVITVLLHQYNFLEVDRGRGRVTYPEFEKIVEWIVAQKDIRVLTLSQTAGPSNDLSSRRFISYNS